ncbi:hypothetical protein GIB67_006121, partial [Kingdonia uniflora]
GVLNFKTLEIVFGVKVEMMREILQVRFTRAWRAPTGIYLHNNQFSQENVKVEYIEAILCDNGFYLLGIARENLANTICL